MEAGLTIEQLAAESGMSVRNIRAHQARGLLSSPEVRRRVGYYGPDHVDQLKLIRELQEEGFNLAAIKRLLADEQGTEARVARFRRSLTQPGDGKRAATFSAAELGRRFGAETAEAARVVAQAERLGIVVKAGEDRFQAPSPSLLAVAEEVVARGVTFEGAVSVFEETEEHCDAVSRSFVRLFLREVWRPFQRAGLPEDGWPEIDESIDRLRPLATAALVAIFSQRMSQQIEEALGRAAQP